MYKFTLFTFYCKIEGFVQRIKAEEGEGCNLHGSLEVNKLAGNFHFVKSFHLANMHAHHESNAFEDDSYNISHRINKLSFGDPYPGILNPLDGLHRNQVTANGMYRYFIKVVATVYTPIRGYVIRSNQGFLLHSIIRGQKLVNGGFLDSSFITSLQSSPLKYYSSHVEAHGCTRMIMTCDINDSGLKRVMGKSMLPSTKQPISAHQAAYISPSHKQDNEGQSPYGAAIFQSVGILIQTPLLQPKVFETPRLNIDPWLLDAFSFDDGLVNNLRGCKNNTQGQ